MFGSFVVVIYPGIVLMDANHGKICAKGWCSFGDKFHGATDLLDSNWLFGCVPR